MRILWTRLSLAALLCLATILSEVEAKEYKARISHYCPCRQCCSWHYDSKGIARFNSNNREKIIGQTACGSMAREGLTLAMPKEFPFGTHVYTEDGKLFGVVEDRGGKIYTESDNTIRIDVYMDDHQKASIAGVKWIIVRTVEP